MRPIYTHHLFANHDYSFDCEGPFAVAEQILQARPKQVDNQDVVHAFLAEVIDIGNPRYIISVRFLGCLNSYLIGNNQNMRIPPPHAVQNILIVRYDSHVWMYANVISHTKTVLRFSRKSNVGMIDSKVERTYHSL